MSTPSKKRRAARKWMHERIAREQKEREAAVAQARVAGRADILRDARTLLPEPDGCYPNERGGHDIVSVIKKFPSPYEGVPVFRVPFPVAQARPSFGAFDLSMRSLHYDYVDFRPSENALTIRGRDGDVSLRWFTWEPSDGDSNMKERTSALFTGMNKLAFCARELSHVVDYLGSRPKCSNCAEYQPSLPMYEPVAQISRLLGECADELRLRLGRFAPKTEMDEERERYVFRGRHPHMDTRWGKSW